MKRIALLILILVIVWPTMISAQESGKQDTNDPKPSTGIPQIVIGWIASGIGVVNLAAIPLCSADFYPSNATDTCTILSIGVGIVGRGSF